MRCLKCARDNPDDAKFCVGCGNPFGTRCAKCGAENPVGLASRMQALAPPGSIAITEATRKQCEGYFNFRSLGATKVKGVSETVDIYEVTGLGPLRTRLQRSAARRLTRFIGRDDEMRTLWNRWEVAREAKARWC